MRELKLYISNMPRKEDFAYISVMTEEEKQALEKLREFRETLIREFNGFTEYKARGFWKNPNTGKTEKDSVSVFEILTNRNIEETKAIIEKELTELKKFLRQECFLYSVGETEFFFI